MVLRNYAQNCCFLVKKQKTIDFEILGYTIEELDSMHEFFQEWHMRSKEFAEKIRATKTKEDPNNQFQTSEDPNNHPPQTLEDPSKAFEQGGL